MASFNHFVGVGNLARDPELKFIPSGQAVCNFTIACNRKFKKGEEWVEEVAWIPCVAWGKVAESTAEYVKKGSCVLVDGRLQSRQWEDPHGQKRSALEVVADRVQFLDKKEKANDADIQF